MKFGICCKPEETELFAAAGFDFVELHVQDDLVPESSDRDFMIRLKHLRKLPLPVKCARYFLPGNLKITGPDVDHVRLLSYSNKAFARAAMLGADYIVFGSGTARSYPDGFSAVTAAQQIETALELILPVAEKHGITLLLEPLNKKESNIINTVAAGAALVRKIGHSNFQLLADGYHFLADDADEEVLFWCAAMIPYIQIATLNSRQAPGIEECDFSKFFIPLKRGGYDGMLSVECLTAFDAKKAAVTIDFLRELWQNI